MLEKGLQFGNNGDEPSRLTADIMDASGDEAWPIATFTYLVLRNGLKPAGDRIREGATCDHVKATIEFWNWYAMFFACPFDAQHCWKAWGF